jgi:hypothetical protein
MALLHTYRAVLIMANCGDPDTAVKQYFSVAGWVSLGSYGVTHTTQNADFTA